MTDAPSHRRPSRARPRAELSIPTHISDAAALGWTRSARRHAIATGGLQALGRGVVTAQALPAPDTLDRTRTEQALLGLARASALRCPRAVISHFAAAIAWDLPTFGPLVRPCLTVDAGTALRGLADAHLHRATLHRAEVALIDGFEVTGAARTVMDIAREHGVAAGVVAADHALHVGMIDEAALAAAYELCQGWPGRRHARITLLSADGLAESPLESLSRLRMAASGLAAPTLQAEICDLAGEYISRVDFLWDEFGVVGEADGESKYDAAGRTTERQRRTQVKLERSGLLVVRWGWPDLFDFDPVKFRLEHALERGVRPGSPARRWGVFRPQIPALHP